ncbi:Glycosyl transferase family 2 [Spirosomataceae bacterium TFI 002]|nr:Glycosyl transferase family 2 [Spirosomataceae bacterium TFI 002]
MNPVLLFCYNRKSHTEATINALLANKGAKDVELYIYSDGAKSESDLVKVVELRAYIHSIVGFKKIVIKESDVNRGLASSIISGVSEIFEKYERVVVLEDDILTSRDFLEFTNLALDKYEFNRKVCSISGYSFSPTIPIDYTEDVYLSARASSWGWATWKDRWSDVDWELKEFDAFINSKTAINKFKNGGDDLLPMIVKYQKGVIESWAIRWIFHHFKTESYCLVPVKSKVQNIGTDGTGTNFNVVVNKYKVEFGESNFELPNTIEKDDRIFKSFKEFYRPSLFRKCINYLKFKIW